MVDVRRAFHTASLRLILVAAVAVASAVTALPAQARRIALVIGNDDYKHVERLRNARNDGTAMALALEKVGFAVTRRQDLSRDDLFRAVDTFVATVTKDDEVVFYFAGHGVQIDATPYLLPVDIRADSPRQLTRDALSLDSVLADLGKARYTLALVDACRNNPFATGGTRGIGGERGISPVEPPEGTAVMLAAGRGQTALDRLGPNDREPNGLFTRELIKQMSVPGLPVRDLLLRVRDAVEQQASSANHKQRPALIDESRGNFYFLAPATTPTPPPATADATALELAYWNSIQERGGVEELQLYLNKYPTGHFAELARARIARLTATAASPRAPGGAPSPRNTPAAEAAPAGSEVERLRALAEKGNAAAMGRLGFLYMTGTGGAPRDPVQAAQWATRGAQEGDPNAMAGLGFMLQRGIGGLKADPAQAVALYRRAADAGNARGMTNLGAAYREGVGGLPRDDRQALEWYQRAASAGDAQAMASIGWMHYEGRGVARDPAAAVQWFDRAIEAGNAYGMASKGVLYAGGLAGLPKDDVRAAELYRKAAGLGDRTGLLNLGLFHANGRGNVPRDDAMAVDLYRRALEAGNPRGGALLGYMHETGRGGLPLDLAKATELYRTAAEAGDGLGMNNFGAMLAKGAGGLRKDEAEALAWYRKAAERQEPQAMFNIGVYYRDGRGGLARDAEQARQWFDRAAALGHGGARDALQALGKS